MDPLGWATGTFKASWVNYLMRRGMPSASSRAVGIHICGGRGKHSRHTPQELVAIGDRAGVDGTLLFREPAGMVMGIQST